MNAHYFVAAIEAIDDPQEVDQHLADLYEGLAKTLDPGPTKTALEEALAHYRATGHLPFPNAPGANPVYLWLLDAAHGAAKALKEGKQEAA